MFLYFRPKERISFLEKYIAEASEEDIAMIAVDYRFVMITLDILKTMELYDLGVKDQFDLTFKIFDDALNELDHRDCNSIQSQVEKRLFFKLTDGLPPTCLEREELIKNNIVDFNGPKSMNALRALSSYFIFSIMAGFKYPSLSNKISKLVQKLSEPQSLDYSYFHIKYFIFPEYFDYMQSANPNVSAEDLILSANMQMYVD